MPTDHFSGLPSELRIGIYEHALNFKNLLVRKIAAASQAALPAAALLSVNKLVHREAVDRVYKLNTISTPFEDACRLTTNDSEDGPAIAHPYKSIRFTITKTDEHHICCSNACILRATFGDTVNHPVCAELPGGFGISPLRKLKDSFTCIAMRKCLQQAGKGALPFMDVGVFEVAQSSPAASQINAVPANRKPHITFEYPVMVKLWQHLSVLPREDFDSTLGLGRRRELAIDYGCQYERSLSCQPRFARLLP